MYFKLPLFTFLRWLLHAFNFVYSVFIIECSMKIKKLHPTGSEKESYALDICWMCRVPSISEWLLIKYMFGFYSRYTSLILLFLNQSVVSGYLIHKTQWMFTGILLWLLAKIPPQHSNQYSLIHLYLGILSNALSVLTMYLMWKMSSVVRNTSCWKEGF